MSDKGLIQQIFSEAQAYKQLEDLESLVEKEDTLAKIPIQPLFMAIQAAPRELIAQTLAKMTPQQRQAVNDLSLWQRDHLDIENFSELISAYAQCPDGEVIEEFAQSHDFLLFLKARLSLHTFDVEDPVYPDHDYYFLTEDNQLLIEYGEDFEQVEEVKFFIRSLYSNMGVENAYSHLFKYISDVYSIMEEDAFQHKKSRLREYGFVDYYEALEFLGVFNNYRQIEKFVNKKSLPNPTLSQEQMSQAVHSRSLVGYRELTSIDEELSKVSDQSRLNYLKFHLLRFVNGTLSLHEVLKKGKTHIAAANQKTERLFMLGFSYLLTKFQEPKSTQDDGSKPVFFDIFDFFDCFKVGNSLVSIEVKKLQRSLAGTIFEEEKFFNFLGDEIISIIDSSKKVSLLPKTIEEFTSWRERLALARSFPVYIQKLYAVFQNMKIEGQLQDDFYINYRLDDIDFEALILSSFVHSYLGHYQDKQESKKMGVTIEELKKFSDFFTCDHAQQVEASVQFAKKFGLFEITGSESYLLKLCKNHLEGYDYSTMSEEDYKHVGGPIILNLQ